VRGRLPRKNMRRKKLKPTDYVNLRGKKQHPFKSPQEEGEEYISGTIAGLESDDDVLEAAHEMGIGLSEDYEHPKELDIARDVEKEERYKRTH
jgi:hypothetical protein